MVHGLKNVGDWLSWCHMYICGMSTILEFVTCVYEHYLQNLWGHFTVSVELVLTFWCLQVSVSKSPARLSAPRVSTPRLTDLDKLVRKADVKLMFLKTALKTSREKLGQDFETSDRQMSSWSGIKLLCLPRCQYSTSRSRISWVVIPKCERI